MKKYLVIITMTIAGLFGSNAYAAVVKCDPAKFERFYSQDGKVFVQLAGMPWHVLGFENDSDLTNKMDKIHMAKRKNRWVQLQLPNNYAGSCLVPDHTVAVKNVLVKKNKEEFGDDAN